MRDVTPTLCGIHEKQNSEWITLASPELPDDLVEVLSRLAIFTLDEKALVEEFRLPWLRNRLSAVSSGLGKDSDATMTLLLGSQWLLKSLSNHDPISAFVNGTTALEILLGDKKFSDIIGIGTLLANRCAYLIGSSHSDRAKLIEGFRDIYDIRSQVVHAGKTQLTSREQSELSKLQWMCKRVICRELELMAKDNKDSDLPSPA